MALVRLKPFVPGGAEYARSRQFYADLGFEAVWEHAGLAELARDGVAFILQDFHQPVVQRQIIVQAEVDDLDGWWEHIRDSGVLDRYDGVRAVAPTDHEWGRQLELVDPAGVRWHFV